MLTKKEENFEDLPTAGGRTWESGIESGDFAEEGGFHKVKNLSTPFSVIGDDREAGCSG